MNKILSSKICVRVEDYTYQELKELCKTEELNLSFLIRELVKKIIITGKSKPKKNKI